MVPTVFLRQSSYRRPRCHPADPARDVRLHNAVPCRVRRTASGATHSVVDGESNETGKSLRQRAAIIPRFSPGGFHRRPLLQNNRISLRHFRPLGVRLRRVRQVCDRSGSPPIADIPPARTWCHRLLLSGKSMKTDYVYVMDFDGDKIRHMTKIWHSGLAMKSLGWV
jgi:hypothetical protein